jgi:hypothetical protein
MRTLKEGGFTTTQADQLVRSGLVGKARPEDAFRGLASVSVDDVSPKTLTKMLDNDAYGDILSKLPETEQISLARAFQHLENSGVSPEEIASYYDKFKDEFQLVLKATDQNSDGATYLADIIRKNKQAGVVDDAIKTKIDEAFKGCK